MRDIILIFLGSGLGGLIRYFISICFRKNSSNFPFHTLLTNILACFIVGCLVGYWIKHSQNTDIRNLILIGFCGGLSTYSTFNWEILSQTQNGMWLYAMIYIVLSLILCLLSTQLGIFTIQKI